MSRQRHSTRGASRRRSTGRVARARGPRARVCASTLRAACTTARNSQPARPGTLGGPVSGLLGGLLCGGLLRGAPLVPVALLGVVLEGLLGVVAVRAC